MSFVDKGTYAKQNDFRVKCWFSFFRQKKKKNRMVRNIFGVFVSRPFRYLFRPERSSVHRKREARTTIFAPLTHNTQTQVYTSTDDALFRAPVFQSS